MKTVGIAIGRGKDAGCVCAKEIATHLLTYGCRVLMADAHAKTVMQAEVSFVSEETMYRDAEMVIVLGGDGSILAAARTAAAACGSAEPVPLLGVNLGRVGYMAELEVSECDALARIVSGEYTVERRMMLDVSIVRGGVETARLGPALNDVVIANGPCSRIVHLALSRDGETPAQYSANGLIIATPTGSTAYSMAAGGPVLDPEVDCLCVTPICSHALTARPIIFSDRHALSVYSLQPDTEELYLTVDGQTNMRLGAGDTVVVRRSAVTTRLVRVKHGGFMSVLQKKMK